MRAVIQRVLDANVKVEKNIVGEIGRGLLVLLGIKDGDSLLDINYIIEKIVNLRIFEDENEKLNLSMLDLNLEILVVSQFTLYGDCRKGRRPSFSEAASPENAKDIYDLFVKKCIERGIKPKTGVFQADMKVSLVNDGPVTILLDSEKKF